VLALLERDAEDVTEERLGRVDTDAAHQVPEDDGGMPVEQQTEARGRVAGRLDHVRVRLGNHHVIFPAPSIEFAQLRIRNG